MSHEAAIDRLSGIYARKNMDYGNSAHVTFVEFGEVAIVIRLADKLSRLESLLTGRQQHVADESVADTIGDAVNYLVMLVAELDTEATGLDEETSKAREANIGRVYELFRLLRSLPSVPAAVPPMPYRAHLLSIWKNVTHSGDRRDLYFILARHLLREYERMTEA